MWQDIWNYIIENGSMWGFIGSIIVLIVNLFVANKGKKESLRAYVDVERVTANPELNNYSYQEGSRLIKTEEYNELISYLNENRHIKINENEEQLMFLKIKNISSNPCYGVKIRLILQDLNVKKKIEEIDIYVLKDSGELYIPLISFNSMDYLTRTVEVEYTTLANEKMIYKTQTIGRVEEEVKVIQSVYVRRWYGDQKIIETSSSNLAWIPLK